ncbi:MAG: hypothetical protein ACJAYG_001431 [Oceanicoccus sp.]|jgi:hypothetical protein
MDKIIVVFISAISLIPALAQAAAGAILPAAISIKDFGIYQLLSKKQQSFNADTTAGFESVIDVRLLKKTQQIPLQQGLVFGFNYRIEDIVAEADFVEVELSIVHPETQNFLGKSSAGFSKVNTARLKTDGYFHNGAFYIFSQPEEMLAGEWVISVRYKERYIASRRFNVVHQSGLAQ